MAAKIARSECIYVKTVNRILKKIAFNHILVR